MNTKQNAKEIWSKTYPNNLSNFSRKEVKMSTKAVLRILIPASLIAVVLLAVLVINSQSAPASITMDSATEERLAGSDDIRLHPPVPRPANYYIGSDWIERHPTVVRPANYYEGSDWIERHPPQDPYAGSDWIERHPSQPDK